MKIDTFSTIAYEEDERAANPTAYFRNGTGDRRCQHVTVSVPKQVETLLETLGLYGFADDVVHLSIWWKLPRKACGEENMYVTASGYTCSKTPPFCPTTFILADNRAIKVHQEQVREAIDLLNSWEGIDVKYQDDLPYESCPYFEPKGGES